MDIKTSACHSFIHKGVLALVFGLLLIAMIPCSWFLFVYWSEMPIILKVFGPIIVAIVVFGTIIIPFNGMVITKKGTILFVPDFRLLKLKVEELERMAFIFNQWENQNYSVTVKLLYKDGRFFIKNYSKQFRNMKNKRLAISMYTISKRNVDRICDVVLDLDICNVTIVDENRNITYQQK